jgi:hypothetical protein
VTVTVVLAALAGAALYVRRAGAPGAVQLVEATPGGGHLEATPAAGGGLKWVQSAVTAATASAVAPRGAVPLTDAADAEPAAASQQPDDPHAPLPGAASTFVVRRDEW